MPDVPENIAKEILQAKKLLIWVGAGTSFTAGVPTDAADRTGLAWKLALIHYGDEENVTQQLSATFRLADLTVKLGKQRIRDLLLQLGWADLAPAPAHRAIAALLVEGFHIEIVTTNFDPLLERSVDLLGRKPEVIYSGSRVRLLSEDALAVVKVHGCPYLDTNCDHLLLLEADLVNPPGWVVNFLNGRLQERVFVYSGFSGNAAYVRESIKQVTEALEGELNVAFGVDLDPGNVVFAEGNPLGAFYAHCQVEEANYTGGGADDLFNKVADLVFQGLLLAAVDSAMSEARAHGALNATFLQTIIKGLSYDSIRGFAKRMHYLATPGTGRLRDVDLVRAFKWMILLTAKGVLEPSSFRPVLSSPYHPGPASSSSAPIVFFDGSRKEALMCLKHIHELANKNEFKRDFQLAAVPRWFAVVFNCSGLMDDTELDIIPREPNPTAAGYDPVICRDENSLLAKMPDLGSEFRL